MMIVQISVLYLKSYINDFFHLKSEYMTKKLSMVLEGI